MKIIIRILLAFRRLYQTIKCIVKQLHINSKMSWYLFKDVPSVNHRGIKVQGFQDMHRPRLNLSWGRNEKSNIPQNYQQDKNIIPTTIIPSISAENENMSNIKVLTETSEDDEEELAKLIKNQQERRRQQDMMERNRKLKDRGFSLSNRKEEDNGKPKQSKYFQIDKRIRYLENSLLPISRRDNMCTIFDHKLGKEAPLDESRMSGKSCFNKKNESSIVLGNGYNAYSPLDQPKKDLTQKFKEMYEYDDLYKRRIDSHNFKLG